MGARGSTNLTNRSYQQDYDFNVAGCPPAAGGASPDPNGNHYSTTGTGGNAGGAVNQSLKPSTPTQKKGSTPGKQ